MDSARQVGWADIITTRDLDAAIKDLKATLLMWLMPTILGSIALAVTLARAT